MTERKRDHIDTGMLNPVVKGRRVKEISQTARPIPAISESVNATEDQRQVGELADLRFERDRLRLARDRLADLRLERDRLADQLRALEALYKELQTKEEYLALFTYELRVPLTAVQLEAQLLERQFAREGNGDSPQAKRALSIVANARRVNVMLQEWFKSRSLESRTMHIPAQARDFSTNDMAEGSAEVRNAFDNMSSEVIERLASASDQGLVELSEDLEDLLKAELDRVKAELDRA